MDRLAPANGHELVTFDMAVPHQVPIFAVQGRAAIAAAGAAALAAVGFRRRRGMHGNSASKDRTL